MHMRRQKSTTCMFLGCISFLPSSFWKGFKSGFLRLNFLKLGFYLFKFLIYETGTRR